MKQYVIQMGDMRSFREHGNGTLVRGWQAPEDCAIAIHQPANATPLTLPHVRRGDWVVLRRTGHLHVLGSVTFTALYQGVQL